MTSNVVHLGAHERMTPEECLAVCRAEVDKYTDVIVIAYDAEGEMIIRSSNMTRKDAFWMMHQAADHAKGIWE